MSKKNLILVGEIPDPGPALLRLVQGAMTMAGTSLSAWAVAQDVDPRNLAKALLGNWEGPRAAELVRAATAEAGITVRADPGALVAGAVAGADHE